MEKVKFVIYGAGKRGKETLKTIGKENVIAFVDQDCTKVGTQYCSLPVIGIEDLKLISKNVICVISPVLGRENIQKNLYSKGIEHCIQLKPFDRALYYEKEQILEFIIKKYSDNNIGIFGVSAGSIILYQYLIEKINKQVFLFSNKKENIKNSSLKCDFIIPALNIALSHIDIIISTELNIDTDIERLILGQARIITLKELLESNIPFYNRQIEEFKNIHKNQRCFIIATGPSLSIQDLEILWAHNEVCISMNRVYNIFNRTTWRPNYYMIEDTLMIEDLSSEIADIDVPVKFVSSIPSVYWEQGNIGNSIKFHLINLDCQETDIPLFSSIAERCIYEGSTVTYACIQMAAYMGFNEIYLLGVDFNYCADLYDEKNHFSGYQNDKKIRLNSVQPGRMKAAYESAKQYSKQKGIKIYNASRGGKLEVFDRVDFDSLFLI